MAFRMSKELQNSLCNKVVDLMSVTPGAAGTGKLSIYTGAQPATANTAASGTLLVEIEDIGWGYSFEAVPSHSAVFDVDGGGTTGTITASGTEYAGIETGDIIVVTGTADNNGTYEVLTVATDNVITVTTVIAGADGTEAATVISPRTANKSQLASAAGYAGTAVADGTAGWARLEDVAGNGSFVIDGDVGTSTANVFTINVATIATSGTVTLLNADIYMA